MSHLPRRRPPALAKTRGELRTYHQCDRCDTNGEQHGYEWHNSQRLSRLYPCAYCTGTRRYLVDTQPIRPATAQARTARNDATENHGRQPYD